MPWSSGRCSSPPPTFEYALDAITEKYRNHGTDVKIIGLNDASILMHERLAGKLGAGR